MSFCCKILYLDKVLLLITTPRKAAALNFRTLPTMSTLPLQGRVIFTTFLPDSGFGTHAMVVLPYNSWDYLNEAHTNSYTGPRLCLILRDLELKAITLKWKVLYSQGIKFDMQHWTFCAIMLTEIQVYEVARSFRNKRRNWMLQVDDAKRHKILYKLEV